ncbi:MAG: O-antigen ligase family protein [Thermoleophilaceae bacterium]
MSRSPAFFAAASTGALGAALAAVAFGAAGGTELGRTTVVELLLVLAGAAVLALAIAYGPRHPLHGGSVLAGLAALVALTALSVLWSIAPELTFVEAGRALAYLAVFAAAIGVARLAPDASPALLKGILLGAAAVTAYALASRVWPGTLAENELSNRIGQPYSYWNAVGTTAALMVPAALWLGARRTGGPASRAMAYPVLGMAVLAILLTGSRGALAAAAAGTIAWLAIVPLRLRSLPVVLLPIAAASPVAAWALSKTAFSTPLQPVAVKESVAGDFGGLVLLMVAVLFLAGLAVSFLLARKAPPIKLRKRAGVVAVAAACALPLALFTSVAFSDRGLGGTISDRVHQLTNESAPQPGAGSGRLTSTTSSRSVIWREAWRVFKDHQALGTGAGSFANARLHYRRSGLVSRHAHGFLPQTLADLGLVGVGTALALLAAWLVVAARTTGLHPRRRGRARPASRRDWDAERISLVSLALVAVVFGLQSGIDWTWFVPGPAVMALLAAGFVVGRGPIPALAPAGAAAEPVYPEGGPLRSGRLSVPPRGRLAAAAAVLVTAVLFAWAIWQPEASNRASDRALALIDQGDFAGAAAKADDAASIDPLSSKPLLVRAAAEERQGYKRAALVTLERAVTRYPDEPLTWLRLARFQLDSLDRPRAALDTVGAVLYLDPRSQAGKRLVADAQSRIERSASGQQSPRRR